MSRVFIIGMPVDIRASFDAAATIHQIELTLVLAAPGSSGPLELRPYTGQAVADFDTYLNSFQDWSKANVIILPYAELPPRLDDCVELAKIEGGRVLQPVAGEDGWPKAPRRRAPDRVFYDALYTKLAATLFPAQAALPCDAPSVLLRNALIQNPLLVAAQGIFDYCDDMSPLRYQFVADTLTAFLHIVEHGSGGRIDAFFDSRGLGHAQSGGSLVKVEIWCAGKKLKAFNTYTHVKRGDHTSAEGAARIYYCLFQLKTFKYFGLLYIGAHPDGEMRRWIDLPEGSPGTD